MPGWGQGGGGCYAPPSSRTMAETPRTRSAPPARRCRSSTPTFQCRTKPLQKPAEPVPCDAALRTGTQQEAPGAAAAGAVGARLPASSNFTSLRISTPRTRVFTGEKAMERVVVGAMRAAKPSPHAATSSPLRRGVEEDSPHAVERGVTENSIRRVGGGGRRVGEGHREG